MRIVGGNGSILVPDRTREEAALRRAAEAGIAPQLLLFTQPEGLSVTRYLTGAHPLTIDEFTAPDMVPRLAALLREVHALAPIEGVFDPYADIRRWLALLDTRGATRPDRLPPLLARIDETERRRAPARGSEKALCHNDPYHLNFLDDGSLWLIDWEYAGMGDPMYDLASIGHVLDRDGRDLLLESYFGSVEPQTHRDLEDLIAVVVCWNVVWSLVQANGGVAGFEYLDFTEELLDSISDQ